MTIDDLRKREFTEARADVVADVALFLCGQDEENTQAFLSFGMGF